ncbi:hypothetical protein LWI29_027036 [Acer saccharum]|uniref:Leucine-rich repeat-containing N-terminal plant-type domain-containing protein n=1 Tax=Acer saccharum TaxID=4024 RepID=A0AA39SN01_ACESA|nr:hypothetical protein LWI29_027036 [Acer saccharum]
MLHPMIFHLILLFLSCFAFLTHQACNQFDQQSLLSFQLYIPSSSLNWPSSGDCCLWEGITCDASGNVTRLWLPSKGLNGTISPSIGNLTHLSHLNLSHNRLFGPPPITSFSTLIQLQILDLSYNRLTGEFPSTLLSNHIELVNLSSNQFHGLIPSSYFQQAGNLMSFNVSNNSFTGPIPSSAWIDSSCSVRLLDLSYNDFSGQVPPGLGNCSKLTSFRAGFNKLSGPLPDDIYTATSLEEISLPVNSLSGTIGNDIVHLENLTVLELYSNKFTGMIPVDIGRLTKLKHLLLHINNLSGSLPPSMKNCTNLTTLILRVNVFEGDLSAFNFSTLSELNMLDLGNNNFTGILPSSLYSCKSLTAVRLASNRLEGQISSDIAALGSLSFLSLSSNNFTNLTGAIRSLMGLKNLSTLALADNFKNEAMTDDEHITFSSDGFQNLQVLGLGDCQLYGQLPAWLGNLRKLRLLDLSLNQISGSIPGWLLNLPSLFYLDLSYNFISGEVPKELSGLQALVSAEIFDRSYLELPLFVFFPSQLYKRLSNLRPAIYLRNNSLGGSIPAEIGNLKFLHVLDLSRNNLSGNIPDEMSHLTNLEKLDLSGNHLSGEIPASFKGLSFLSSFSIADNNLQGPIPSGGQFDTFPPSSFEGNPGLCGAIVKKLSCLNDPPTTAGLAPMPISESSNKELGCGLIAGAVFGLIIGITGILPASLYSCKSLTAVRLADNRLEGQISPDIAALGSLSFLSLSDNNFTNLTGAIRSLMGLKNLSTLVLTSNFKNEAMTDDEHITFSSDGFQNLHHINQFTLQVLSLGGCQPYGQLPAWLGNLRKLRALDLSLNQISGSIPGWLLNLPSLFYLDLSYNFISGEVPKELSGLQVLVSAEIFDEVHRSYLELPLFSSITNQQYNQLINIPPGIYLENNRLGGSIPAEIGNLKFLHVLNLSRNNLSGNIPDDMSHLTNLEKLDLSGNHLSGEIPASLKGLYFLSSFSIADNNLQGPIPSGGQFDTFPPSSFEGNPGLCGAIVKKLSCLNDPPTTAGLAPMPISESSNKELGYGLIAGAVFGLIIGITGGALYPLPKLKFMQHSRYNRRR